jgi:two-component system, NarL family, nitrate/nitrite response regulator NarL
MACACSSLRVLVVDDNERVRYGITEILRGHCEICGEAENGAKAIEMVRALKPDVVLLDLSMPVMNGDAAAQVIRAVSPATRIVFISVDDSPHVASLVKAAGAVGFVSKNCGSAVFRDTIDMMIRRSAA